LDFDDEHGVVEPALEPLDLARELGDVQGFGSVRVNLGAALLRGQRGGLGGIALTPPSAQRRRIDALTAQQRVTAAFAKHQASLSDLPVAVIEAANAFAIRSPANVHAPKRPCMAYK